MNKLIFHIGFHKAASTFLQKNIFPKFDVNYAFLNRELLDDLENTNFNAQKFKSELTQVLNSLNYDTTLISHEELSGYPERLDKKMISVVAHNIKELNSTAKIIIIIRNQFSFLSSLYTFRVSVKGYEFRSLKKFLDNKGEQGLFEKLEYSQIISHYYSVFGKNNVLVIPMELIKKDFYQFINDIADFIGVENTISKTENAQNVSIKSMSVLNFYRFLNIIFFVLLKFLEFIIRPNNKYPFAKLRYSFYFFKKMITNKMIKLFNTSNNIDITNYHKYNDLYKKYASDNLKTQNLIKYDLKEFSYPI